MKLETILNSKKFQLFLKSTLEYINYIENSSNKPADEYFSTLRKLLINLYSTAIDLSEIELITKTEISEKFNVENLDSITAKIKSCLVEKRYYNGIWNPTDLNDKEIITFDLLDDLQEIYRDLKSSLMIFEIKSFESIETALFQFKNDFELHWDHHCINALRGIHFYLSKFK